MMVMMGILLTTVSPSPRLRQAAVRSLSSRAVSLLTRSRCCINDAKEWVQKTKMEIFDGICHEGVFQFFCLNVFSIYR